MKVSMDFLHDAHPVPSLRQNRLRVAVIAWGDPVRRVSRSDNR